MKLERGQRVLIAVDVGRAQQATVMGYSENHLVLQVCVPLDNEDWVTPDPDLGPDHREALYDPVEDEVCPNEVPRCECCIGELPDRPCDCCGGYH